MSTLIVDVSESSEDFSTWTNQDFISEETRYIIANADILITPLVDFRESAGPTFERGTELILASLRKRLPNDITVDICVNDEDYFELSLNSKYKRLGKFVVTAIVLPIFVNVIADLISENSSQKKDKNIDSTAVSKEVPAFMKPATVSISITVVNKDRSSKQIEIEGESSEVIETLRSIDNILNNGKQTLRDGNTDRDNRK